MPYAKFYEYKIEASYDQGETWVDTGERIPSGDPIGTYDTLEECMTMYRTIQSGTTCVGYDKHNQDVFEVSYDNGVTWSVVSTSAGTLIEADSPDCGYVPPPSDDYLTFVAQEAGTFTFSKSATTGDIQYSKNGGVWTQNTAVTVVNGDVVKWKGEMTPNTGGYNGIGGFSSTGNFVASGTPMSLLFGDNFSGQTDLTGKDFAFYNLFMSCSGLTSIDKLVLPATTLSNGCYYDMFYSCTSLTTVPKNLLPATTATNRCYQNMFRSCSSLTTAPDLPATTLDYRCYGYMFQDCASLTTAPELSATTLADRCYEQMFKGCTSLTKAPTLPAATLTERCYYAMFNGCTSLNEIRCYATDVSATNCTYNWVYNIASSGNFYKKSGMDAWTTGVNGIPSGWTVVDYS